MLCSKSWFKLLFKEKKTLDEKEKKYPRKSLEFLENRSQDTPWDRVWLISGLSEAH